MALTAMIFGLSHFNKLLRPLVGAMLVLATIASFTDARGMITKDWPVPPLRSGGRSMVGVVPVDLWEGSAGTLARLSKVAFESEAPHVLTEK